jgi:hypothetical protein
MDNPDYTARIRVALRVLSALYNIGGPAGCEDVAAVRQWAGDKSLSDADAAIAVIEREIYTRKTGGAAGGSALS